ncbi:uncharacterized protein LOC110432219 [Sorghum bicolor]|nr:uncharacterized protein LOC110432219 [Sorghum bicolor]|eukprot:XP_021307876.1 uncharacterized protein LOC110432219 [Sorghum bicolor]
MIVAIAPRLAPASRPSVVPSLPAGYGLPVTCDAFTVATLVVQEMLARVLERRPAPAPRLTPEAAWRLGISTWMSCSSPSSSTDTSVSAAATTSSGAATSGRRPASRPRSTFSSPHSPFRTTYWLEEDIADLKEFARINVSWLWLELGSVVAFLR